MKITLSQWEPSLDLSRANKAQESLVNKRRCLVGEFCCLLRASWSDLSTIANKIMQLLHTLNQVIWQKQPAMMQKLLWLVPHAINTRHFMH